SLTTAPTSIYPPSLHDALPIFQAKHILNRLGVEEEGVEGPFNVELFSGSLDDSNSQYFFQGGLDTLERYTYSGIIRIPSNETEQDRKSTRLNSSHVKISYAVFC